MYALLIVGASLFIGADDPVQKEKERLSGAWDLISLTQDGNQPAKPGFKTSLILNDTRHVIHMLPKVSSDSDNPGTSIESGYTIDPAKKPAAMDITFLSGPEKGKTIRAIYVIERDQLKICQTTLPGKDRPTEFASKRGTLLQIFKKRE